MDVILSSPWIHFLWLAVIIIFLVVELLTADVVAIWLSIGSLFALIVSLIFPEAWLLQIFTMVISSGILIIFVRRITVKFLRTKDVKTNVDSFIGKRAIVTQQIQEFDYGEVKVNGVLWTAAISDLDESESIDVDDIVEVCKVEGSKLYVKIVKKK